MMWKIERLAFTTCSESSRRVKLIEGEKVEDFEDDLEILNPFSARVQGSRGEDVAADDLAYEHRFECTYCGHEWTEFREGTHCKELDVIASDGTRTRWAT